MKCFFTYVLLFALTLQSFYRTVMAMDYQIHLPDYIAQCINKDRPQMHCNGQCVLMQKIKEKEKEETKKNLVVYEFHSLYMHKEQTVFSLQQPADEPFKSHFPAFQIGYRFAYNSPIFRPPIG